MQKQIQPFHLLAKPAGPACNMACSYCFYLEKNAYYPGRNRMSDEALEAYVRGYLESHPGPEVNFLWQGGEPLLMGLDFYKKAVSLQRKYRGQKRVTNSLQTNGTLLTEQWCQFLRQNRFLVGVSLDGPESVHDAYRKLRSGKGSFAAVMAGIRLLQQYGIEYNITCCVSDKAAQAPKEVYRFFKSIGAEYIQFAPLTDRLPTQEDADAGCRIAPPEQAQDNLMQAPGTVDALAYGKFLTEVFDEWICNDIGRIYVMNFEWALAAWAGRTIPYCVFSPQCGSALAVEHNGDVYACDHYVYPQYLLGNLCRQSLDELLRSDKQVRFQQKKGQLSEECRCCPYVFACNGGCPKDRFLQDHKNCLCAGYKYYFAHIEPYMREMADLLKRGKPPYLIRYRMQEKKS